MSTGQTSHNKEEYRSQEKAAFLTAPNRNVTVPLDIHDQDFRSLTLGLSIL